jgi:hypothetical protein
LFNALLLQQLRRIVQGHVRGNCLDVEGTAVYVYDRNGTKLGSVYNFMVEKRSGQVAYAVLSFGGFLGMGTSYHPFAVESAHL